MAIVHWYNPGYEAAFSSASDKGAYTPPKNVVSLRRDLATLPLYWAQKGEKVLVPESLPRRFRTPVMVSKCDRDDEVLPWGYSPEVRSLSERIMYSDDEMAYFADRVRSLELYAAILRLDDGGLFGEKIRLPRLISEGDQLPDYPYVLKKLRSSSGRGVTFFPDPILSPSVYEGKDTVIAETLFPKVEDVGFEFVRSEEGRVTFLGTSLFETETGRYVGNRLGENGYKHRLEREFASYLSLIQRALEAFDFRGYIGPLGIDTLTYCRGEELAIAPLIEINIRRTMGHLALDLERLYPEAKKLEVCFRDFGSLEMDTPLYLVETDGMSLSRGRYPLTPITADTGFCAVLTV